MYSVLVAALLYRPTKASFIFVATATFFQYACGNLDGQYYFTLGAACDLIVAAMLFREKITRRVLNLILLSLISIILNLSGNLMWWFYQPLGWYSQSFQYLYLIAFAVILCKDDEDVRCSAFYFNNATHRPNAFSGW